MLNQPDQSEARSLETASSRCPFLQSDPDARQLAPTAREPELLAPSENSSTARVASEPVICPVPRFWRRVGAAAFLFFLIKGLLWLIVPAGLILWRWTSGG